MDVSNIDDVLDIFQVLVGLGNVAVYEAVGAVMTKNIFA